MQKDIVIKLRNASLDILKKGVFDKHGGLLGADSAFGPSSDPSAQAASGQAAAGPAAAQPAQAGPQFAAGRQFGAQQMAFGKKVAGIGEVHEWGDGRLMRKVGPSHWVPVDAQHNPIPGETAKHIDPHEEDRMINMKAMREYLQQAGNVKPWGPFIGHQGERGVPQEGEAPRQAPKIKRIDIFGDEYEHQEAHLGARKVVNAVVPEKKLYMQDEIMRGGGYGVTVDGNIVVLNEEEVARPPRNVLKIVRLYGKAPGGVLTLSMSFHRTGMISAKELFVGENFEESIKASQQVLKDIQEGKYDDRLLMRAMPSEQNEKGQWVKKRVPVDSEIMEKAEAYKQQLIVHHQTSIDMLSEMKNGKAFGVDHFELSPDFVVTKDFLEQFGKPTYLSGSWENYNENYDKHIQKIVKDGHDKYYLHYNKNKRRMEKLYYEAANILAQVYAEHKGILGDKHDSKMISLLDKMKKLLNVGRKDGFYIQEESSGDDRAALMQKMDLKNNEMRLVEGGINKVFDVLGANGKKGRNVEGKASAKYAHKFTPILGELRGEGAGKYAPNEFSPEYMTGDQARANVAYYQIANALGKMESENVKSDPEYQKAVGEAWKKESAALKARYTKSRLEAHVNKKYEEDMKAWVDGGKIGKEPKKSNPKKVMDGYMAKAKKRVEESVMNDFLKGHFGGLVAETVMTHTDHTEFGGKQTFGALQANPQGRRVGNGKGFSPMGGVAGVGRDIAKRDKMASMMMLDLCSKNTKRNMGNTLVDSAGNIMAVDNGFAFNHLGSFGFSTRNLAHLADYRVSNATIQAFRNMTADKLKAMGVDTQEHVAGSDPSKRLAVTYDDLKATAARMNGLAHYLEKSGGKMPSMEKLQRIDRTFAENANAPMSTFEKFVELPALKVIAESNSDYAKHLKKTAARELEKHRAVEAWRANGKQGPRPPDPMMPPVYAEYLGKLIGGVQ